MCRLSRKAAGMERTFSFEDLEPRIMPIPECGCWIWEGYITMYGYPEIVRSGVNVGSAKATRRVHRIVYELLRGPIPDGLQLDHLCRVRCCVNPDHLEVVDSRTNTLRGVSIAAANARKTHCVRGHALSGDNLLLWGRNKDRVCKTCARAREQAREARIR